MTTRRRNRLFHVTADAAGIRKPVTVHSLRRSFRRGTPHRLMLNAGRPSRDWMRSCAWRQRIFGARWAMTTIS
jgi:hypothetical protein